MWAGVHPVTVRCLLTNAILCWPGEIQGAIYPGNTRPLSSRLMGEVTGEFAARQRQRADVVRTNQNALLAGLLFCKSLIGR